ncbi:MAG: MBL fold metallo-hydrolase [Pseudomonadota bacterium]
MQSPVIQAFFDENTFTASYVVADPDSRAAAVIDPVLDYDAASGRTATHSADRMLDYLEDQQLRLDWILETHVHADHLTAAQYLKEALGGRTGIGKHVADVQGIFRDVFNTPALAADGSQFDELFEDNARITIGSMEVCVWHTPGHTPACVSYLIGDAAFVGDTLFMPDFGTARTDFPGGSAGTLYESIQRLLSLPDETRLYLCHDYKAPGRDVFRWETTVAEQKDRNLHVRRGIGKNEFVEFRQRRDAELGMPALILPSLQANMRSGRMPETENNGVAYFKIPIDTL